MAYKYVDPEKLEKRKRRSTKTSGVFSILIGILCLALGVVFFVALKSLGGMLFCLFFTLVFVGAGVYFFNQIKLEEKRLRDLDDPNSRAYKKRQRTLEKKREKYVRKAEHHGSMKRTLSHRPALIWGVTTVFVWSLSLLLLAWGIIVFILPVLDVMCPIAFVASLFGKNYRTVLAAYKDFEERFELVETKLPALETVRRATLHKIGRFTKQNIRELCPSLSVSSIEGSLRKLVASGELKREGSGKNTCYFRIK